MLFLDFMFEEREITWLSFIEKPLAKIGKLDQLSVVVALGVLAVAAYTLGAHADTAQHDRISTVLVSGVLGLATYLLVNGLGEFFDQDDDEDEDLPAELQKKKTMHVVGKAAFFLFLYLEVLDASFSFDGVIGAFAITSDPILIAIGLGVGAMFIRSLTVFLVRKGTLAEYVYLEHGALWAIGALAIVLLITIRYTVPEVVTGLIGVGFIGLALISSLIRNRRHGSDDPAPDVETAPATV